MRFYLRISDSIAVIVASLMFCDVCGLAEKQHDRDRRELSLKEDGENQTFDPSLLALPQMDYEVLGSSGFSITDFTQNTNFSDSNKMKTEFTSMNSRQVVEHQKNSKTGISLFSSTISQRSSTQDDGLTSPKEHFTINTVASEIVTNAPEKGKNYPYSSSQASAIDTTLQTEPEYTFSNNHTQRIDGNVMTKLSYNESYINSSKLSYKPSLLSASENNTIAKSVIVPETAKTLQHHLNQTNDILITKRTLYRAYNITKNSSLTTKNILTCIMRVIKLLSENSTNMMVTAYKQTKNNVSADTFTTNSTLTSHRDVSTPKNSGNASSSVNQVEPVESLTTPYSLHTEIPGTEVISNKKAVWGSKMENTPELTTELIEDVQFQKPSSSKISHSPIVPLVEENNMIIRNTTGMTPIVRTSLNISPIIFTKSIRPTSTESDRASMESVIFVPASTEKPQILVNVTGQIRIIRGMIWMYQLNDKESAEYQYYSRKVQRMLEEMFWQTWLAKHIKKIDVHRFRRGSVMVDFRLVVKTERHIHSEEMELLFNSFLLPDGGFGGFQMDRHYTKFEVLEPELDELPPIQLVDKSLPQWATALIVISGASLIFVILFGLVTVYGSYPLINIQNHRRLQDEETATGSKQIKNCTDWERKVAAAYENLSADGIYDLDEVGDKKIKDSNGCKINLENTEA